MIRYHKRGLILKRSKYAFALAALVVAFSLSGCSSPSSSDAENDYAAGAADSGADAGRGGYASSVGSVGYADDGDEESGEDREPFDEDAARDAAESELASQPYDGSYGCTIDCSGHEAGWQWRAEHGYAVNGKSNSFSEGGQAFDDALESRVDEMRESYDNGEEPEY